MQRSLLYGTALNQLIKYDTRQRISLHHNVYTSNGERNPQIKGDARNFDFVSNVIHDNTMTTDGLGNGYDPYGTRLWNAGTGSDSPGNVTGNFVANAWVGRNADLEIYTESGASAAGIYLGGNYCNPGTVPHFSEVDPPVRAGRQRRDGHSARPDARRRCCRRSARPTARPRTRRGSTRSRRRCRRRRVRTP